MYLCVGHVFLFLKPICIQEHLKNSQAQDLKALSLQLFNSESAVETLRIIKRADFRNEECFLAKSSQICKNYFLFLKQSILYTNTLLHFMANQR